MVDKIHRFFLSIKSKFFNLCKCILRTATKMYAVNINSCGIMTLAHDLSSSCEDEDDDDDDDDEE